MVNLQGKIALVTGSSRGIGRGCAVELARAGANVTVNYHSHADEAEEAAEEIRGLGREALVVQTDVSDRASVDRMIAATVERFGGLDIAVSNAYYSERQPFLEISIDAMKRTLDVCLWGAFHIGQAAARHMADNGKSGCLLFISSVLSFIPYKNSTVYNTCKAGINHMSRTIAAELAPQHIRSNVIEPGWIDTPGERRYATDEEIHEAGEALPWGRLGTIEEVGRAAAFLCSDDAEYITGSIFRVDGGYALQW